MSQPALSPPIQKVIAAGVVPHSVMSLSDIDRFERGEHGEHGALLIFAQSPNADVREQVFVDTSRLDTKRGRPRRGCLTLKGERVQPAGTNWLSVGKKTSLTEK